MRAKTSMSSGGAAGDDRNQRDDRRRPPRAANRGASQRQRRVAEELRHVLDRVLRSDDCRDPKLRGANITVSEVRISPDLRNATAYVMPLGGSNAAEILAALTRSAGFLRARAARELNLRHAPDVVFALDRTFDQAERITALLARPEVERDLRPRADRDDPGTAETGDDAG
jgi:ribosome-binding factor A